MKNNVKRILLCIYFILLGCVFLNTAFSRYITKTNGEVEVNVAKMKLNVIKTTNNLSNLSNTQQNIAFTVNNYDGTRTNPEYNEIEYQYQILITTTNSIPLQYELYKIENGTEKKVELTNGKSQNFTMSKSRIQEDEFIVKVNMKNKNYKNMNGIVDISVSAVQI